MSLRILYRDIPANKRLCEYYRCRKPIHRNIARDKDGRLYHYGCLQLARAQQYQCLECYASFNAAEASLSEKHGEPWKLALNCPHCGCANLRRKRFGGN